MTDYAEIALNCLRHGVSVFPLRLDGSKAPAIPTWEPYQTAMATSWQVQHWFRRAAGFGWAGGIASGGLEVLDFDDGSLFWPWADRLPPRLFARLSMIETAGGGNHVPYRCPVVSGNHKIAMGEADEKGKRETLIETRGQGGYIVAIGSPPEVHPSGNLYAQVLGPPIPDEIPVISPEERRTLWEAARAFDKRPTHAEAIEREAKRIRREQYAQSTVQRPDGDLTPWDDFDHRGRWADILEPKGWVQAGDYWQRPSRNKEGHSAAIRQTDDGAEVLVVFSSNAGPLAPQGMNHQTWSKFGAYAALYHGGDKRAAARELGRNGYGSRREAA